MQYTVRTTNNKFNYTMFIVPFEGEGYLPLLSHLTQSPHIEGLRTTVNRRTMSGDTWARGPRLVATMGKFFFSQVVTHGSGAATKCHRASVICGRGRGS